MRHPIDQCDIERVRRIILSIYPFDTAAADREDFVSAGMVGLVEASREYDEVKGNWSLISSWRARESARRMFKSLELKAIGAGAGDSERCVIELEPCEVLEDQIRYILRWIRGPACQRAAELFWLHGMIGKEVASELGISRETAATHLQNARKQAAEILASGGIDPSLSWIGRELYSRYEGEAAHAAKARRERRGRQRSGAA